MDLLQYFGILLPVAGLFLWSRTESSSDRRELRNAMDSMHKEIRDEMKNFHASMKDFHSRLLILEERYLKNREKDVEKKK